MPIPGFLIFFLTDDKALPFLHERVASYFLTRYVALLKLVYMKLFSTLSFVFMVSFCHARQEPSTAAELINRMHATYKDTWYRTLTFTQQTEFFQNGTKQREQIWYEAMDMTSGALVIKFDSMTSGNGMIFRNDSLLSFADDRLKTKNYKVHELIVLGFSVYTISPDSTLAKLKRAGFNITYFVKDNYDSRPHYVVGDPEKAQFWIDANTLLFTKLRKKLSNNRVSEIEFKGYQKLGKGWIETEVNFTLNGQTVMREVYSNIQTPKTFPKEFYNQTVFSKIDW
jgi:hypothetical protein